MAKAEERSGVIYILTNPSFPDYVKIGYTDDLDQRLLRLNKSECTPFAFRVYAVYHVTTGLTDKKLHSIIDSLNPDLRAVDTLDGKERKKEFFAMSPEEAYAILENIAEISGTQERLELVVPKDDEVFQQQLAEDIQKKTNERRDVFSFEKCGIPVGAEIVFIENPEIVATVWDDRRIYYEGESYYLTGLTKQLKGMDRDHNYALNGPSFWSYQGRALNDLRRELEEKGMYK